MPSRRRPLSQTRRVLSHIPAMWVACPYRRLDHQKRERRRFKSRFAFPF